MAHRAVIGAICLLVLVTQTTEAKSRKKRQAGFGGIYSGVAPGGGGLGDPNAGACIVPDAPSNGKKSCSLGTFYDCTYTCNSGYQFDTLETNFVRSCDAQYGDWYDGNNLLGPDITVPKCVPVCSPKCQNGGTCVQPNTCACASGFQGPTCGSSTASGCPPLAAPQNGDIHCTTSGTQTQCTVACKTGFQFLQQPATTYICGQDGTWSPSVVPDCVSSVTLNGTGPGVQPGRPVQTAHDATCVAWGQDHYRTFDRKIYTFQGKCEYVLVKDCNSGTFHMHVINDKSCTSGSGPCKRELDIYMGSTLVKLRREPGGPVVYWMSTPMEIPGSRDGVVFEKLGSYILVRSTALGFKVRWDGQQSIFVSVSQAFKAQTCGLCGRYDDDPSNDFETEVGQVVQSVSSFANSWKKSTLGSANCPDSVQRTCSGTAATQATTICNEIKGVAFQPCHQKVNPDMYLAACQSDCCYGSTEGCSCNSLEAYSRACAENGIKLHWRTSQRCPIQCPNNLIFKECGSPCAKKCGSNQAAICSDQTCVDGCFCPDGMVLNGERCVPPEQCPCMHGDRAFQPGSVIPKDCNKCTCKNAQWECTKKRCDSTCSATGDPHYMTFDGFRFNFMGTCSYYMIKSDNFDIIADNIKCGHGFASCTKSITINIGGHRITLSHNHQLFYDNQEITKLPYQDDQIKITMVSSLFMKAVLSNGISVLWDGRTRAYITAPPTFINKTEGLCGTFDYNQKNDFKTLQGIVETDVNAFGNQWKTVQTCANMPVGQVSNPCDSNAQQHEQAKKYCSYLKSDVFKPCHSVVSVQEFYEDCEYDMCACTENIKDCLCPMLGEYAKQCAAKAVSIPWRTRVKECPIICTGGQQYSVCPNECKRTCQNIATDPNCEQSPDCAEGCGCPDNETLDDNGQCIPITKCPCIFSGRELAAGTVISLNGQICTCMSARWDCKVNTLVPTNTTVLSPCLDNEEYTTCMSDCPVTCQSMHGPAECNTTVCKPGCKCKTGFVLEDGKCLNASLCPCYQGGKAYLEGEKMVVDCNECVCTDQKWQCDTKECPAVCSAFGDSHYHTFDGKSFDFQGECSYILAQSTPDNVHPFQITTENVPCGSSGVTCTKSIEFSIGNPGSPSFYRLRLVPGQQIIADPGSPFNVTEVGDFVIIKAPNGITFSWDKGTRIYLKLSTEHKGKVAGLCGNFDGDMINDFMLPQGGPPEVQANMFADGWKVNSYCAPSKVITDTCEKVPHRKPWAQKQCAIISSKVFAACHAVVPYKKYLEKCIFDSCACDLGGDCECLCTAVAAYAHECAAMNVPVAWRTKDFCGKQCEDCKSYQPCISLCPKKTCDNRLVYDQLTTDCKQESCVEGCDVEPCPPGQVFDSAVPPMKCIPEPFCNTTACIIDGKKYRQNEAITDGSVCQINCELCFCDNGQVKRNGFCPTTPGPKYTLAPTLTPGKCTQSFWGPWINRHSPVNGTDFEYMSASELSNFCVNGKVTKINCYTDDPLMSVSSDRTGEISTCRLETGFLCRNADNYPNKCSDYKIRYFCDCHAISSPTPEPTPGPTFSVNTTGPRCGWSSWLSSHTPTTGPNGGEFETIAGLKSKYTLCSNIQKINCRRVGGVPPPIGETRQIVCDPTNGFACKNKDQPSGRCYDYEVQVYCWDQMCEPGHITTSSPGQTLLTTTVVCGSGETYQTCAYQCNELCDALSKKMTVCDLTKNNCVPMCKKINFVCGEGEKLSQNNTCIKETNCPCLKQDGSIAQPMETWINPRDNCEVCQCVNNSQTCTRNQSEICAKRPTPAPTPETQLYPHPKCHWTYWINVDSPLTGTGDSETISVIRSKNSFCEHPTNIECRDTSTKQEASATGQKVTCDLTTGFKCLNWENGGHCNDYELRFYCPCASTVSPPPGATGVPTVAPVTDTFGKPIITPTCGWSRWINTDNPTIMKTGKPFAGDIESIASIRNIVPSCNFEQMTKIECRTASGHIPSFKTGEILNCDRIRGLRCHNNLQSDKKCNDYEVRIYCDCNITPSPVPSIGETGVPTISPPICGWTTWLNGNKPGQVSEMEIFRDLHTKFTFCDTSDITAIECRQSGTGLSIQAAGQQNIICDLNHGGLFCFNRDQVNGKCYDYEIRILCEPRGVDCSNPTPKPSPGANGYPTAQPQTDKFGNPIAVPTSGSGGQPSAQPLTDKFGNPIAVPTSGPGGQPSVQPLTDKFGNPIAVPTSRPGGQPSVQPLTDKFGNPIAVPTGGPSGQPSVQPLTDKFGNPIAVPTGGPGGQPSVQPLTDKFGNPIAVPTGGPGGQPSVQPLTDKFGNPIAVPTSGSGGQPSVQPLTDKFGNPIAVPTGGPGGQPSVQPLTDKFGNPIAVPTSGSGGQPSVQPLTDKFGNPIAVPTGGPGGQPSVQPLTDKFGNPIAVPTGGPGGQPSVQPLTDKFGHPIAVPTSGSGGQPSAQPLTDKFGNPIAVPTSGPGGQPSVQPLTDKFGHPIAVPTSGSGGQPSAQPLTDKFGNPIAVPTSGPGGQPSVQPLTDKFGKPIAVPTGGPGGQPSVQPLTDKFGNPIAVPTGGPGGQPSAQPLTDKFGNPIAVPTGGPGGQPSVQPLTDKFGNPIAIPTGGPGGQPSAQPLTDKFGNPIAVPTSGPGGQPSAQPLTDKFGNPIAVPTGGPGGQPSAQPLTDKFGNPIAVPTGGPGGQPSAQPLTDKFGNPIAVPTSGPGGQPSAQPLTDKFGNPMAVPTSGPGGQPSAQPLTDKFGNPIAVPTSGPGGQPSVQPLTDKFGNPIAIPTSGPGGQPSVQPLTDKNGNPIAIPTGGPGGQPSAQPLTDKFGNPIAVPTGGPGGQPSAQPLTDKFGNPIAVPTYGPGGQPSVQPLTDINGNPIAIPTTGSGGQQSAQPLTDKFGNPIAVPTGGPGGQPSAQPLTDKFGNPIAIPTSGSGGQPTVQPLTDKNGNPIAVPTGGPGGQPSVQPLTDKNGNPIAIPTGGPGGQPSAQPLTDKFGNPIAVPTYGPGGQPSVQPLTDKNGNPIAIPTGGPGGQPSAQPLTDKFGNPIAVPTYGPGGQPSVQPLTDKNGNPIAIPTGGPGGQPSAQPLTDKFGNPIAVPTYGPGGQPSVQPLTDKNGNPIAIPTGGPGGQPSAQPLTDKFGNPIAVPTYGPGGQPSVQPLTDKNGNPIAVPTGGPGGQPSVQPLTDKNGNPIAVPTGGPGGQPSAQPLTDKFGNPIAVPTYGPGGQPSVQPLTDKNGNPIAVPTSGSGGQPSVQPLTDKNGNPIAVPTSGSGGQPSVQPLTDKNGNPIAIPTSGSGGQPSGQPLTDKFGNPIAIPTSGPGGQPSVQPITDKFGNPIAIPTGGPGGQPSVQPLTDKNGNPIAIPTTGSGGQPSVQPLTDKFGNPIAVPTSGPGGQPSVQPLTDKNGNPIAIPTSGSGSQMGCFSGWSGWINTVHPNTGTGDREYLTEKEKFMFCSAGKIIKIECITADGGDIPYYSAGEASTTCNLATGLTCQNADNYPLVCNDYKIRYFCQCQDQSTSSYTGAHSTVSPGPGGTGQPTAVPHACITRWSQWINKDNPSTDGMEREFLQANEKKLFCGFGQLTQIECKTADMYEMPYHMTGETGTICDIQTGLTCLNLNNHPSSCHDYKIRYFCQCAAPTAHPQTDKFGNPIAVPTSGSGSQPSAQPLTDKNGNPIAVPTGGTGGQPSAQPLTDKFGNPIAVPTGGGGSGGQPSVQPLTDKFGNPIAIPTYGPGGQPSVQPLTDKFGNPIAFPTSGPGGQPTVQPLTDKFGNPIAVPTGGGGSGGQPSVQPLTDKFGNPISIPTYGPGGQPSVQPLTDKFGNPIAFPTSGPGGQPTVQPLTDKFGNPIAIPTGGPGGQPSAQPLTDKFGNPIAVPTSGPGGQPSAQPLTDKNGNPIAVPTGEPGGQPTVQPLTDKFGNPIAVPTGGTGGQPSVQPLTDKFGNPIAVPTGGPGGQPTVQPLTDKFGNPIAVPTGGPGGQPTVQPLTDKFGNPIAVPTGGPAGQPTVQPLTDKFGNPIAVPTGGPGGQPSVQPLTDKNGNPIAVPTSGSGGQPSAQPQTDKFGNPIAVPTSISGGQPSVQPLTDKNGNPIAIPTGGSGGQPSAQPQTDKFGNPIATPGPGSGGQPSVAPSTCTSKWSSWINKDHPNVGSGEREFMTDVEKTTFCGSGKITKIECITADGGDVPYYSSGEIGTTCDVATGLTCLNANNFPMPCSDYKVRYYCDCPVQPTAAPIPGQSGQPTVQPQTDKFGNPIPNPSPGAGGQPTVQPQTDKFGNPLPNPSPGAGGQPIVQGQTDQFGRPIATPHQGAVGQPSVAPSTCTSKWSSWINKDHPNVGSGEREFMTDVEKTTFCGSGKITKIECITADGGDVPYYSSGEIGTTCDVATGLTCLNANNFPMPCSDYKVRYYCDCPVQPTAAPIPGQSGQPTVQPQTDKFGNPIPNPSPGAGGQPTVQPQTDKFGNPLPNPSPGAGGQPIVQGQTDKFGRPIATPHQGAVGQPSVAPSTCTSKWSSWINKDHPNVGSGEREFMTDVEKTTFCGSGKITKIECITADGGDVPYYSSGEIGTTCDVATGLTCLNANNFPMPCSDYKVRYYCDCPVQPTAAPIPGQSGQPTVQPQTDKFGNPIPNPSPGAGGQPTVQPQTDKFGNPLPNPSPGAGGQPIVQGQTDQFGRPIATPHQGAVGQPSVAPSTCTSKWSSWINKDHPNVGSGEREFMTDVEKTTFCGSGKITKIECITADGGDVPYYSSGEIGTTCDVATGLTCLNANNFPMPCSDYKVRYYCDCPVQPTAAPIPGQSGQPTVQPQTDKFGNPIPNPSPGAGSQPTVQPQTDKFGNPLPNPSPGAGGQPIVQGQTDQFGRPIATPHQGAVGQPSVAPSTCTSKWSSWINKDHPNVGSGEREFMTDVEKTTFCGSGKITKIECITADGGDVPYYSSGEIGTTCDVATGLTCLNANNFPMPCSDYKVRYYCDCPVQPTAAPIAGQSGQPTVQPQTDKFGNPIPNPSPGAGGQPTVQPQTDKFGNPLPNPSPGAGGQPIVQGQTDQFGRPIATPHQGAVGQPSVAPSTCTSKWSSWINKDHPNVGSGEREFMTDVEKTTFCGSGKITKIECITADGGDVPYYSSGEIGTTCDVATGLTCLNANNFPMPCSDYKVRYYCDCPDQPTAAPVPGAGGQPTVHPQTDQFGRPIVTPHLGASGQPIVQGQTDQFGRPIATPHQGAFGQPSVAPSTCTSKWSSWINKDHPNVGSGEREFMTDVGKMTFCGSGKITKIECITADGGDVPYYSSGEIGTTCDVANGLTCLNANNFPMPCSDYKVRYYCDCPDQPTAAPVPGAGGQPTVHPQTDQFGRPIVTPHQGASGQPIVQGQTDQFGRPIATPHQGAVGQPSVAPSTCTSKWSSWINKDHPNVGSGEREFMTDVEKTTFCGSGKITKIECITADGGDVPYYSSGEIGTTCDVATGLTCLNANNFPMPCSDYKVRYYCDCPDQPTAAPVPGAGGQPTVHPQTDQFGRPIVTPHQGASGQPIVQGQTDQFGRPIATPHQGAVGQPSVAPSTCTSKWSSWINKDHPNVGSGEREFMTDVEKTTFCGSGKITKIECITADGGDVRYYSSGEIGTTCDVATGLTCLNANNFPMPCSDYKVRYYCDCPDQPTAAPVPGAGGQPTVHPQTDQFGQPIVTPHQGASGQPIVQGQTDQFGRPIATPHQGAVGQPSVAPITCTSKWSSWINKDHPDVGSGEREFMTDVEKTTFCGSGKITKIECITADGGDVPYYSSGEIGTTCDVATGLTCLNANNFPMPCSDYKVRYYCDCPAGVPTAVPHPGNSVEPTAIPATSLVGIPEACKENMGMENHQIRDHMITASSYRQSSYAPKQARPDSNSGWMPQFDNKNQFIQVDFLQPSYLTGVTTQGRVAVPSYVTSYFVKYSSDGINWNTYKENGQDKLFSGNFDSMTPVTHFFTNPIRTQFIRINPQSWYGKIALRFEVHGCYQSYPAMKTPAPLATFPPATPPPLKESCYIYDQWVNVGQPTPANTGDIEPIAEIKKRSHVCLNPVKIECQTAAGEPSSMTDQVVTCTLWDGLICNNADQITSSHKLCYDYRVRLGCLKNTSECVPATAEPLVLTTSSVHQVSSALPCFEGLDISHCPASCPASQFCDGMKCVVKEECTCNINGHVVRPHDIVQGAHCDTCKCISGEAMCIPKVCPVCTQGEKVIDVATCTCSCKTCSPTEYRCGSGECIPRGKRCDGVIDCTDDEVNCTSVPVFTAPVTLSPPLGGSTVGIGKTPAPTQRITPVRQVTTQGVTPQCLNYTYMWSPWVNNMNGNDGNGDKEMSAKEYQQSTGFCAGGTITKVECWDNTIDAESYSSGAIMTCNPERGLICNNDDNFPIPCDDYKIRYYCAKCAVRAQPKPVTTQPPAVVRTNGYTPNPCSLVKCAPLVKPALKEGEMALLVKTGSGCCSSYEKTCNSSLCQSHEITCTSPRITQTLNKGECCPRLGCVCPSTCPQLARPNCKPGSIITLIDTDCNCTAYACVQNTSMTGIIPTYNPPQVQSKCVYTSGQTKVTYNAGEIWNDGLCKSCRCENRTDGSSEISCHTQTCPPCQLGEARVNQTGECCGKCVRTGCVVGNQVYKVDQTIPSSRKCFIRTCAHYDDYYVKETNIDCGSEDRLPDCKTNVTLYDSTGCCKTCKVNAKLSAAHTCAECEPQLTFGNKALTVGYFRVMKNGTQCQNNNPVSDLYECSGYCKSQAKYTSVMQGFSNNCYCCQPNKTVTKSIQLSCADGTTMNKTYTVPQTCHCGVCAGSRKR